MRGTWVCLLLLSGVGCAAPCAEGEPRPGSECADVGPDWSADATLPPEGHRANIYGLEPDALEEAVTEGLHHATSWPVDISGVYVPYDPLRVLLEEDSDDSTVQTGRELARVFVGFESMDELYRWVGAPVFNGFDAEGPYFAPHPEGFGQGDRMGVSLVETQWGRGLTFSCLSCHAGRLLGRTVVGLPNRQSRANAFFDFGKDVVAVADPEFLVTLGDATESEVEMLRRAAARLPAVGNKIPEALGLDTSLAQVALSLARRQEDAWATRSWVNESAPRPNALETFVADSKPMPFWTMKYKTRWLADGSIVAGNPVHTNFLWNELGRGTDLPELERWLDENNDAVRALTAAVFASEAPRWTDYFDAATIDVEQAQRGAELFEETCSRCHGRYEKGWQAEDAADRDELELLETVAVRYHDRTPLFDVGTDTQRREGMTHFADRLNSLEISRGIQTVVEPQSGYVPPPLNGIWARYPYLHNNAVPSLCALLTVSGDRPTEFVQGPSESLGDFDEECVGYPVGDDIPESWRDDEASLYRVGGPGMSNAGHDEWLTRPDGGPTFSVDERDAVIMFLKTL